MDGERVENEPEMAWVSQYNLEPEVLGGAEFSPRLRIYDTTVRDGEQTVGLCFDKQDKLEIARALDAVGVERIEAGMPVVSREDRQAAEMIVNAGLKAEVWGFCRCVKADIDACADSGVKRVICEIPTSAYKMKAYGMVLERVLDSLVEHLRYAKEKGMYTAYFAVDATRTPLSVLETAYTRAVREGGADEVTLVDTLGVANPETVFHLTRKLREWVDVPVMIHCHNEFGLGTACTLAGLKAGADWAQVTVNALGEKTGNTDLAEVALAGKLLYGLETSVDLKRLPWLAQKVAAISRIPVHPLKPVVGDNVFRRETGVAVAQLKYPPAVEGFAPELVGKEREVVLGKKSGKASIEYVLAEVGMSATPAQIDELVGQVKSLGIQKKGPVERAEFEQIVRKVVAG